MLTSSVILDIVILAVVAVSAVIGAKRGLFRSLAELVCYIAAYVITSLLAGSLAASAAQWLRPIAEERIRALVGDYLSGVLEEVPSLLSGGFLEDLLDHALPEAIVEQALYNLAYAIVFVVVFLLVVIALRLLIRAVDTVLKLPLLHEANALGGGAIGALKGLVIVGLLLWLARQTGHLISAGAMEESILAPIFLKILPF